MAGMVSGHDVNTVLKLVASLSTEGDGQLTILALAFVTACRATGVERAAAVRQLDRVFADPPSLVRLAESLTAH